MYPRPPKILSHLLFFINDQITRALFFLSSKLRRPYYKTNVKYFQRNYYMTFIKVILRKINLVEFEMHKGGFPKFFALFQYPCFPAVKNLSHVSYKVRPHQWETRIFWKPKVILYFFFLHYFISIRSNILNIEALESE